MRVLLAAGFALTMALLAVAACPAQAEPTDQAHQIADGATQKANELLDNVNGKVEGAVGGASHKVKDSGSDIRDAANAFGKFVGQVAAALGGAAVAAWNGLSAVGSAAAQGLAEGLVAVAMLAGQALDALGQALVAFAVAARDFVAAGFLWLGAQLAALAILYAKFVTSLRPAHMDEQAFAAIVATGTAAVATAAGYGLWAALRKWGWLLAAPIGLFSRIADDKLLDHPMRAQVFQVIQANPGIHASALSRQVDAGWGTITHHLEKLEKARLVTTRRVNNQKCYFEDGGRVSSSDMAVAGAVRGDSAQQITLYVSSHPMTSQKAMAQELGISAALTSFHVKKLVGIGVLEKIRQGKETLLTTTQAVRRVMTPAPAPQIAVPQVASPMRA